MKKINIQEYLSQGDGKGLTEIVILEGNTKRPNDREIILSSLKRDLVDYDAGHKSGSYEISSYYGLTFIAEETGSTGLGNNFEGAPVTVRSIDASTSSFNIIVVNSKYDKEGVLLEHGDALLVSNKTDRDTITGTETYDVAYMSADDFTTHFKPLSTPSFQPSFEPNHNTYGDKTGAKQTAPYIEQLNAISDWPKKDFDRYHKYITARLKREFTESLTKSYKATLLAGGNYHDFNRLFEEKALSIATGCTDSLGKLSEYKSIQLMAFRDFMNSYGFEESISQSHGDNHLKTLANNWAEDALEKAKNSKFLTHLNPDRLANAFIESTTSRDAASPTWLFKHYEGKNQTLKNALRATFSVPCLTAYNNVAAVQSTSKIPLIGKKLVKSATEGYAKEMEFKQR